MYWVNLNFKSEQRLNHDVDLCRPCVRLRANKSYFDVYFAFVSYLFVYQMFNHSNYWLPQISSNCCQIHRIRSIKHEHSKTFYYIETNSN